MSSSDGKSKNIPERGFGQRMVEFGEKLNEFIKTFDDTSKGSIMKAIGVITAMGVLIAGALWGMLQAAKHLASSGVSAGEFLVVVAGVYGVAKAGEAIAHLLETLEGKTISKSAMFKAAAILAALIIVFWAIAEVVTNVVQALSTTTPPDPATISAFEEVTMTVPSCYGSHRCDGTWNGHHRRGHDRPTSDCSSCNTCWGRITLRCSCTNS